MKKKICQYLSNVLGELSEEELLKTMELPSEEKMGDLALPCFVMAKKMRKSSAQIASELVEKYGVSQIGIGKTVCMDYSSPNIAKNFHVGHLRTTVIGNSLYKMIQGSKYLLSLIS